MNTRASSTIFGTISFLAAAWVAYGQTLSASFHLDDEFYIVYNRAIQSWGEWGELWRYNPARFVTFLTLAVNYRLGGLAVGGYHVFNLAIHLATSVLVYALVCQLLTLSGGGGKAASGDRHWAFFAAMVFLLHPLQTQAITYIWQRSAALAAFFFLLALVLYLTSVNLRRRRRASENRWLFAAFVAVILALLTKQNTVTLPLAILVLEFFFFTRFSERQKVLRRLLPFVLLSVFLPVLVAESGSRELNDLKALSRLSPIDYALTQLAVCRTYLRLTFLPFNQMLDYDYPVAPGNLSLLSSVAFWALVAALAWRQFQEARLAAFGWLLFLLGLVVESSIVPLEDVIFEHRLYLPMAGLLMVVVEACRHRRVRPLVLLAVIGPVLLTATILRNRVWATELSLWRDNVAKAPAKYRPRNNLAAAYSTLGRHDLALPIYERILRENPGQPETLFNMAEIKRRRGDLSGAAADYRQGLTSKPRRVVARIQYAKLLIELGQSDEAMSQLQQALAIDPKHPEAHYQIAALYYRQGRHDRVETHLRKALEYGYIPSPDVMERLENMNKES